MVNDGILLIPQCFMSGASPSDAVLSHTPDTCWVVLLHCKGAVGVFFSSKWKSIKGKGTNDLYRLRGMFSLNISITVFYDSEISTMLVEFLTPWTVKDSRNHFHGLLRYTYPLLKHYESPFIVNRWHRCGRESLTSSEVKSAYSTPTVESYFLLYHFDIPKRGRVYFWSAMRWSYVVVTAAENRIDKMRSFKLRPKLSSFVSNCFMECMNPSLLLMLWVE